jgi:putative inorganic carbon (hco3(-)) transporter
MTTRPSAPSPAPHAPAKTTRLDAGALICGGVFLLPLVCWPNLEHPFSTPKLWLLAALAALSAVAAPRAKTQAHAWPLLIWLGVLGATAVLAPHASLAPLLLAALPLPLAWAAWKGAIPPERLRRTLLWASAVESAVACLQFAGADPLRLAGWQPEAFASPRMRVYGSLGNPDFVAAWLCATLPLFWFADSAPRNRALKWAALALQLAALAATGSRAALLAIPATLAVGFAVQRRFEKWAFAALAAALALTVISPGRPLETAARGRLYLARVALAHWSETPASGFGPGSFEGQFAIWQTEWLRQPGAVARAGRFAGPVDHAHNDYVEFYVEYGPVGVCGFVAAAAWLLAAAWKRRSRAALCGGAAALLAAACVDFPFHRPAEWALLWLLLAAAGSPAVVPLSTAKGGPAPGPV